MFVKWVKKRAIYDWRWEAQNILKPIVKYLGGKPSKKLAPFDLNWFQKLHEEMYQLEQDIKFWEENETYDIFELSVRIHFKAVHIHPFLNGNGRWSRLLGNIFLKQNDHPLVKWPEETIGVEKSIARDAYLAAVKKADTGDMSELIALHRKYLDVQT